MNNSFGINNPFLFPRVHIYVALATLDDYDRLTNEYTEND